MRIIHFSPLRLWLTLRLAPPESSSCKPGPHLLLQSLFLFLLALPLLLVLPLLLHKLLQARGPHRNIERFHAARTLRLQQNDAVFYVAGVVLLRHTASSLVRSFFHEPLRELVHGEDDEVDDRAGAAAAHGSAVCRGAAGHFADAAPPVAVRWLRTDHDLVRH